MRDSGPRNDPFLGEPGGPRSALLRALAGPLPGAAAQLRMAPFPRPGWREGVFPPDARRAGVLVLLWFRDGGAGGGPPVASREGRLVLTRRTVTVGRHPGQVSLPGGEVEPGESPREAALREASEEIGLSPAGLEVLGPLSPLHVPVSGFVVHPFVALALAPPSFHPDPREVERVLEVSLRDLADPARQLVETWRLDGRDVRVPFFAVGDVPVWGATAMILAELLALLGRPPRPRETGRRRDLPSRPGGGVAPRGEEEP